MSSPKPRLRRIEVLLIVVVLAIGLVWFSSVVQDSRYYDRPTRCAANLRGIMMAMHHYAENGDFFPMATTASRAGEVSPFAYRDRSPPMDGQPSPTADIWMVLRQNNATPKMFNCPTTLDSIDPAEDTTTFFDFADRKHLSYSYVYQYHSQRRPVGINGEPTIPLLADANPYLKGSVQDSPRRDRQSSGGGNSRNHFNRQGQNVAFVDGHVSFMKTPLVPDSASSPRPDTSVARDNIYTTHADNEPDDPGNAPTWTRIQIGSKSDYCLVP